MLALYNSFYLFFILEIYYCGTFPCPNLHFPVADLHNYTVQNYAVKSKSVRFLWLRKGKILQTSDVLKGLLLTDAAALPSSVGPDFPDLVKTHT